MTKIQGPKIPNQVGQIQSNPPAQQSQATPKQISTPKPFEPTPQMLSQQPLPQSSSQSAGGTFKAGLFPRLALQSDRAAQLLNQARQGLDQFAPSNWRVGARQSHGLPPFDQRPPMQLLYGNIMPGVDGGGGRGGVRPPVMPLYGAPIIPGGGGGGGVRPPIMPLSGAPIIPGGGGGGGGVRPPIMPLYGAPIIPGGGGGGGQTRPPIMMLYGLVPPPNLESIS